MTPPHPDPSSRNRHKTAPPRIRRKGSGRTRDLPTGTERRPPTPPDHSVGLPRPSERGGKNVLIVEDDPTFAKLLTHILRTSEEARYRSTVTTTVRSAMERLGAEEFDVIIADLGLPDSREYDTIEALTDAAPEVPLVILTGTAGDGVGPSLEAVRRGASYFLRKGNVDAAAVERGIHYATERKQLSDILDNTPASERGAS